MIYADGQLMGFNKEGRLFAVESERPTRRKGYIRAWEAKAVSGIVNIDETCWTCNGWLPVTLKTIDELIGAPQS